MVAKDCRTEEKRRRSRAITRGTEQKKNLFTDVIANDRKRFFFYWSTDGYQTITNIVLYYSVSWFIYNPKRLLAIARGRRTADRTRQIPEEKKSYYSGTQTWQLWACVLLPWWRPIVTRLTFTVIYETLMLGVCTHSRIWNEQIRLKDERNDAMDGWTEWLDP